MKIHITMNDGTLVNTYEDIEQYDLSYPMARADLCMNIETDIALRHEWHPEEFDLDGRDVTLPDEEAEP